MTWRLFSVACTLHKTAHLFFERCAHFYNVRNQYYPFKNVNFHHYWVCKKNIFEMKNQPISKPLSFKESNTLLLEAFFAGVETTQWQKIKGNRYSF